MLFLLTVPWVGLQYVIVIFPDHTHLFFIIQTGHLCLKNYNCKHYIPMPEKWLSAKQIWSQSTHYPLNPTYYAIFSKYMYFIRCTESQGLI